MGKRGGSAMGSGSRTRASRPSSLERSLQRAMERGRSVPEYMERLADEYGWKRKVVMTAGNREVVSYENADSSIQISAVQLMGQRPRLTEAAVNRLDHQNRRREFITIVDSAEKNKRKALKQLFEKYK